MTGILRRRPAQMLRRARLPLAVLAALLLLSGCAYAGVLLAWGWPGAALLAGLALAGCGVPAVDTQPAPKTSIGGGVALKSTFDASTLLAGDGSLGFVFTGPANGRAGTSVSMGDFNHDGFADVAIGAPHRGVNNYGGAYIVFGGTAHGAVVNGATPALPVTAAFYGQFQYDYAGQSVAFLGDTNLVAGDDLAIGSPRRSPNTGSVAIVFGTASPNGINILAPGLLDGIQAAYLIGDYANIYARGQSTGSTVAFAGDMNLDGNNDVLIGAPYYTFGPTLYTSGRVYEGLISAAQLTTVPITLDVTTPPVANVLRGPQTIDAYMGNALAGGGDVDGDGFPDVAIGIPSTYTSYDHAFVHFNPGASPVTNNSFPSVYFSHFGFRELNTGDGTGEAVALADLDGDGLADVIIASYGAPRTLVGYASSDLYTGRVHVIFGSPALAGTSMVETQLDGTNGFTIIGENAYDTLGLAVAATGDVNGDGIADLAIAARDGALGAGHMKAYIVFGGPRPGVSEIHLSQMTSAQGIRITGLLGYDLSLAGGADVDGDGAPDLVIGSRYANASAGAAYTIYRKALEQ